MNKTTRTYRDRSRGFAGRQFALLLAVSLLLLQGPVLSSGRAWNELDSNGFPQTACEAVPCVVQVPIAGSERCSHARETGTDLLSRAPFGDIPGGRHAGAARPMELPYASPSRANLIFNRHLLI
jgi:hypothetical protein